jgi:Ca2+-binding EF-hand superfamily protein
LDAELRAAFDVYDINGDRCISVAELSKLLGHGR